MASLICWGGLAMVIVLAIVILGAVLKAIASSKARDEGY